METAIIIIIIIIITIITLLILPRLLLLCDGVLVTSKCLVNFIKLSNYQIEKRYISWFSSLSHHTQVLKNMLECVRKGFPGRNGKESACQCRRLKRHGFDSWVRKIPWRRKWQPIPDSSLENSMDRGVWRATVPGVTKSQTWLSMSTHAGCVGSTSLVQEG